MKQSEEYLQFLKKFETKKTTDDCYTPPAVYDAVADWASAEYGFDKNKIVRPFYPGGDYEAEDYPDDCIVLDNPPFSILSKILQFYNKNDIKFFLFAPSLTLFSSAKEGGLCYIACDESVIFENGARVNVSFITNMDDALIRIVPELQQAISQANRKTSEPAPPKYEYPPNIVSAAMLGKIAKQGVPLRIERSDTVFVRHLDSQRLHKKAIYGGGFLLSDRAAAEKMAAEKMAAEKMAAEKANTVDKHYWPLSDREKEIIASMDERNL